MKSHFTQKSNEIINGCSELVGEAVSRRIFDESYDEFVPQICQKWNCTKDEAEQAIQEFYEWMMACREESRQQEEDSRPRCPTCRSTNIKKVSATSKVGSVVMWGIFSQKVKKQFHCNNCGYEW